MKITRNGKYKFKKKEIRDAGQTAAAFLCELVKEFRKNTKATYPKETAGIEEWHKLLQKMGWSFAEIRDTGAGTPSPASCKSRKEYLKALAKYDKKVQEGLNLFAKHYHSLWS